jgi:hypothetical protein
MELAESKAGASTQPVNEEEVKKQQQIFWKTYLNY